MKRLISFISFTLIILLLSVSLVSCAGADDTTTEAPATESPTTEEPTTESPTTELPTTELPTTESPTTEAPTTSSDDSAKKYYSATVSANTNLTVTPYTGESKAPEGLDGIYYSTTSPGGMPTKDETGSIWLKVVPTKKYAVSKVNVEGVYTSVEMVEQDIYRISGVGSDLSVTIGVKGMPVSKDDLISDYGYAVSDNGELTVKWVEDENEPLRYMMITYTNGKLTMIKQVAAFLGECKFSDMAPNLRYDITMQAISYDKVGKEINFNACFMNKPKEVAFPRVEITTQDFLLPSFDVVNSPSGSWGQGITNAFYEQCVMTIYNKNNEVVFNSTSGLAESDAYLGAKIKVRGNTSAAQDPNQKYPYKVKLNTKADLLEPLIGRSDDTKMYAHKDWLLLNYGEEGYRIGGEAIADAVGTAWSPDYCYVTLYVNGDYRGLYVLSESVSRGTGEGEEQWRVAVDKEGYLFECDAYWWNEDLYFDTPMTSITPMLFTFKHPDPDNFDESSPEYLYIKDYMIRFEEALNKEDDSYLEFIDLESFAKWLLVSDYLCINDGGGANIYLYKKDGTDDSKVFLGPNWDFDSWMANAEGLSTIRMYWKGAPFYIPFLLEKDSFQTKYVELFNETKDTLDEYIDKAFEHVECEEYEQLLSYENSRFGTKVKSPTEVKEGFKEWLDDHIEWMDKEFN